MKARDLRHSPLSFVIGSSLPEYRVIMAQTGEDAVAFVGRGFAFLSEAIRFHVNFNLP
jgi:hypothetical protein